MTTTMPKLAEKIRQQVRERLEQRDREYREECREYKEQGFAPHYCKHGTNLWVDYDPICPGCEDGMSLDEEAEMIAGNVMHDYQERTDQVMETLERLHTFRREAMLSLEQEDALRNAAKALMDYAMQPLQPYLEDK